jgi:hypothetical protein
MSIKTNSKLLLTVFLVGSLSGYVNASQDDLAKEKAELLEEGSRLQITGAYNLLTAQIAALETDLTGASSAAALVASLAVNPVINAIATAGGGLAAYNTAVANVSPLITTALATPNRTNILAVQTSINTATTGLLAAAAGALTAPYATTSVLAAVNQLDVAVDSWLAFYPA